MKLKHEFIQLPLHFDQQRLQKEIDQLERSLWTPHHEGFKGNLSIPLVSLNGQFNNLFKGPMAATSVLQQTPYLKQVIGSFGEVIGRSRLMGLESGCEVPLHSDINYHWYKRVRIHIPIVTDPNVIFHCGDKQVHMKAGEAWIFDSWKYHRVDNNSQLFRVHLVIDICGSSRFWDKVESGHVPWLNEPFSAQQIQNVAFDPDSDSDFKCERFNTPLVLAPGEMEGLAEDLISDVLSMESNPRKQADEMVSKVKSFCHQWRELWSLYGLSDEGWPAYHRLRQTAYEQVMHLESSLKLTNGTQATRMFLHCMIDPALNVEVKDSYLGNPLAKHDNTQGITTKNSKPSVAPTEEQEPNAVSAEKPQVGNDKHRKLGRNDICYCGSGLKFKHCHGKLN
ncbi:aspartyl/asparaginyl beta-hydroxylase domain-containing protein [Aliiglaciecola sp. 3_MG-2023]|uniref:aspartyl/asparaginyl beta-hydroxylase domain-containing protein n=1 Tax=Aliiglaciecola sp. 3_MG-2023 TaxID=3062644 RepID=UPI0026E2F161|nr:aspartyl/asparaginyl beta-hydroxylase domain-containing protein [Aliiglaciecola sp. 3_MG-2023]MDO6695788.1 aspartyl/asparaginyl beta-hydroxylase domain-containing protein [Aliiglaciecola sp. 3_MG-2023]